MVPLASFLDRPLTLDARRAHDVASGMALDRRAASLRRATPTT
jgi:hypothetical protein